MAVASLQVTKTYADGLAWTEARMDTAMQSIQTYTNTSVVNNLNQIKLDAFGSALTSYDYDNDGSANLTNSLYNKQSASVYSTIQTPLAAGNTVNAEASLAYRMVFTPEKPGKYRISYQFVHGFSLKSGGGLISHTWRIRNRTAATFYQPSVQSGAKINGTTATANYSIPVTLSRIVNFASTAVATISLFYSAVNSNSASIEFNVIRADTSASYTIGLYGSIEKI